MSVFNIYGHTTKTRKVEEKKQREKIPHILEELVWGPNEITFDFSTIRIVSVTIV